jgi:hypothetical protein
MPAYILQTPETMTTQCAAPIGEFLSRFDCRATHRHCKAGFTDLPVQLQAFTQNAKFDAGPKWIVTIRVPWRAE